MAREDALMAGHYLGIPTPKLLVVEENEGVKSYLNEALGERYDVVPVGSGEAALRQNRLHLFTKYIIDLGMNDMNGLEVAQAIRQTRPTADITLITGGNERLVKKVQEYNAASGEPEIPVVMKPLGVRDLVTRLVGPSVEQRTQD